MFDYGIRIDASFESRIIQARRTLNPILADKTDDEVTRATSRVEFYAALCYLRKIPFLEAPARLVDPELLKEFQSEPLLRGFALPIAIFENRLTVALADPFNHVIDYLANWGSEHGIEIDYCLSPAVEISDFLNRHSNSMVNADDKELEARASEETGGTRTAKDFNLINQDPDQITAHLQQIFTQALSKKASDIHFQVERVSSGGLRFYYHFRVDGDLGEKENLKLPLVDRYDAILLGLAGLAPEMRATNPGLSGQFTVTTASKKVDVRYERTRSRRGFHCTCRLLDKSASNATRIGEGSMIFHPKVVAVIKAALELPDGMIMMSGPTGSGKSTTMLAFLRELNRPEYKIVTIENPVEEEIEGVIHCELHGQDEVARREEARKYIESDMRSDPDIIYIAEVRDLVTAGLAIEASSTGHQVLGSIHTRSAAEIRDRFVQLGIEEFKVSANLRCLCAQRLVRTLCNTCKKSYQVPQEEVDLYHLPEDWLNKKVFRRNKEGCSSCRGGLVGRHAILDALPISEEMGSLISTQKMTSYQMDQKIRDDENLPSMKDLGLWVVEQGWTEFEQLRKVIDLR